MEKYSDLLKEKLIIEKRINELLDMVKLKIYIYNVRPVKWHLMYKRHIQGCSLYRLTPHLKLVVDHEPSVCQVRTGSGRRRTPL